MKNTHQNAIEIAKRGGAIAASDWTTGSGRFVSKRPIPELCVEISAAKVGSLRGQSRIAAERILKARPRIEKLIVVADWRKLNAIRKAAALA